MAVLRTFSKAYGLAGLRVGFLVGHEPVAAAVRKTMLTFTVNSLAQAAAVASLAAEAELLDRVEAVVAERQRVCRELAAQGWTVPPTEANFVWLRLGEDTGDFAEACDRAGISVRPFAGRGRPDLHRRPARPTTRSSRWPPRPTRAAVTWSGPAGTG